MATETGDKFDEEGHRQTSEPPAKLDIDAVHSGDHLRTLVMRDQYGGAGRGGGQGCGDGRKSTTYSRARDGRDNRRSGRPPCNGCVQIRSDNGRTIGPVCPGPGQAGELQRGTDFVDRIPGYERQGLVCAGPSQALDKNGADGVVVTHGTDTLEETAFFLDNVLHGDKPVVIVGSMRPATAVSADGPGNLYEAVQVAADPRSRGRGVMAVLNDMARSVTKTNTTSIETFNSPNGGPIGYVDTAGGIRFMSQVSGLKRTTYELPTNEQLPRVEIVYSHANMDAVPIEDAISHGAKGIVLAGVGDGNTSKQALDALEMAAKKGIIVVRSTRVRSGFVTRNVEVDDDKNGFVVSEDLSPQKARVLTQLLIASGVTAPAELQRAFTATW